MPSLRKALSSIACAGLSLVLALGMSSCRPTDFFTEVIITADAEKVDEGNSDTITINSPDARKESSALAALDWTEKSGRSQNVQNLVVWSKEPTTDFTTHHSIFDLAPRFLGIEASDGVRLEYDRESDYEHEIEDMVIDEETLEELDRISSGESSSSDDDKETDGEGQDESDQQSDGEGDSSNNTSSDEEQDTEGEGNGQGSGDGEGSSESDDSDGDGDTSNGKGYNGSVPYYNPSDALADVPETDSVGVIGKQAAVLVQALGGKGAIAAMSKFDYSTKDVNTSQSFKTVFGSNSSEFDASSVYLWEGGSSSRTKADLSKIDVDKLIEACGKNGVIIYDQDIVSDSGKSLSVEGSQKALNGTLTTKQKKKLYASGITFMPVDFSSVKGMEDGATLVGKVLANSKSLSSGWSSKNMAKAYRSFVEGLTSTVSSLNKSNDPVYGTIATNAQAGLKSSIPNTSTIALFSDYGQKENKPLTSWMHAVGVSDAANTSKVSNSRRSLSVIWPNGGAPKDDLADPSSTSGGAYSRWVAAGQHRTSLRIAPNTSDELGSENFGGLGSHIMPYLIVCGGYKERSSGADVQSLSSSEVKSLVVNSIEGYRLRRAASPYSAFGYQGTNSPIVPNGLGFTSSFMGDTNSSEAENPFYAGLSASDAVRANPSGILGSWTESTFESVLETVWLANVYSESPSGCSYDPEYDWSRFSVNIGDVNIKGSDGATVTNKVITQFYKTFYRYNATYADVAAE